MASRSRTAKPGWSRGFDEQMWHRVPGGARQEQKLTSSSSPQRLQQRPHPEFSLHLPLQTQL